MSNVSVVVDLMIRGYGPEAPDIVDERIDEMRRCGDWQAVAFWSEVGKRILNLQIGGPGVGEGPPARDELSRIVLFRKAET